MRAILLETSSAHSEVALADSTGIVVRQHLSLARQHARDLIPAIADLLHEADWTSKEIDVMAVDIGPGSYTGLRVGVVTAKMFCYATGARLVGVDAMTLLALGHPDEKVVWGIVDAQQQQVYTQEFRRTSSGADPIATSPIQILPADDWARRLNPDAFVTGPALARFAHALPAGARSAAPGTASPSTEALAQVVRQRLHRDLWDDPWTLAPHYLRDSSAQIRWDARTHSTGA